MLLIAPSAVILGVTIFSWLSSYSYLVKWVFAFISFVSCLGLNIRSIRKAVMRPFPIIVCLVLLQLIMPSLAYGIANVFFANDPYIIMGFVLAYIIPTGVVSLMWVSTYNGNRALTLTIVLINTLLSPLLVPYLLHFFIGTQVSMDTYGLMIGLFWMIVAPSILGVLVTRFLKEKINKTASFLSPFSKFALIFVILVNGAVVAPYFRSFDGTVILIAVLVFIIACIGFIMGFFTARIFKWEKGVVLSIMYNTGMRNNGAGAALAVAFFPPSAAFPIVTAILFQQFLASIFGRLANYYFHVMRRRIDRRQNGLTGI
nr:bile acid:sodium symporter family protein [Evansella tamaricis]